MSGSFRSFKLGASALRRVLTGDLIYQFDMTIHGGQGFVSLQLKRDRRSGDDYVVLAARTFGSFSSLFEIDEFDRFIAAADGLRTAERNFNAPPASRVLSFLGLVPPGQVLCRGEVPLYGGQSTASVRLMRERTGHQYFVIAMEGPGQRIYYRFEQPEFHQFLMAAKEIRDLSGPSCKAASQQQRDSAP
jgi:hypothetical protein